MQSAAFEVTLTGNHSISVPNKMGASFIAKGEARVLVKATFKDASVTFHAALQKDKTQTYRITFGRNLQKQLGVAPEDHFKLQFFSDPSKYGVEIPEELEAVLQSDEKAFLIFESLTPGKKRSLIYMILKYRNSQTKIDKSLLLAENLKRGIRDHKELLRKF